VRKIVISQPMFFPWIGIFEQMRLSDVFVHYDNVLLPQGRSFVTRVRIKSHQGKGWLTMPVKRKGLGRQTINSVQVYDSIDWRKSHLRTLQMEYARAPYRDDILAMVEEVYTLKTNCCSELNIVAAEKIANYFELPCQFIRSSDYHFQGGKSEKLIDLVRSLGGGIYITGHGALNYMDYELFEANHIQVKFMDYQYFPYPQLHGAFDPYVSILDLIANQGKAGKRFIASEAVNWKEFISRGPKKG
jgi:WbqC-like protein family